ncbi:MAG: zinc ribbon domain-containing protein [Candidatus Bathyarchaeia archaeon]|jgi:hypothetical protein
MLARSKVAILIVVAISSVTLFQTVEGACGVHVGVPGAPIQVGSPFVISYYTDVGCNGMTTVLVRPALSVTPIWQAGPTHVSGGLDYEVTAPGINTPGGYFAEVSFVKTGGNTAVLGEKLFQVVGPASVSTNWAIQSVSLTPSPPQVGDPVTFSAVLVALSTSGSYPQSVDVECTIDGASCGGGSLSYPGPTGNPATVNTQTQWIATPGTHTLTWSVSTNNDPNPGNNVMSTTFIVGQAIQTTTQFDFSLSDSPTQQSATPGGSASYTVAVNPVTGPQQSVDLSVSGLPNGVSASFNPTSGTPPFTSTLSVTVASSVSPGALTLTIVGNGGGVTHTASVTLIVSAASDFAIGVSPASQSVLQGQTASYSVNVSALNGFNSQVSLSVSGLPSGADGVFSNPSGTPNFASTLTVTLSGDVAPASYTLTVTGSGGGLSHVANLVLTVNAAVVTQSSTSSTQASTQPSSDLMSMIQQNQLLILGGIILLAVLIAVALRSRRKPTSTQPTGKGATTGFVYCGKCGTQNPTANKFCKECGTDLK